MENAKIQKFKCDILSDFQTMCGDLINFVDNEELRKKKSLTPDRISSWPLFHIQTTSSGESWSAISVVIVSFRRVRRREG